MLLNVETKTILHRSDACYAKTIPILLDKAYSDISDKDECNEQFCYESLHSTVSECSDCDCENTGD